LRERLDAGRSDGLGFGRIPGERAMRGTKRSEASGGGKGRDGAAGVGDMEGSRPGSRAVMAVAAVGVAVLGAAVYEPATRLGLSAYDDTDYVAMNRAVHQLDWETVGVCFLGRFDARELPSADWFVARVRRGAVGRTTSGHFNGVNAGAACGERRALAVLLAYALLRGEWAGGGEQRVRRRRVFKEQHFTWVRWTAGLLFSRSIRNGWRAWRGWQSGRTFCAGSSTWRACWRT